LFLKSLNPVRRIRELAQELRRTREERDQARQRNEQLKKDNERLEKERQRLEEEIKRLRKELETAQRATRRQAAPFSRGLPKSHPKTPGRKSGAAHGPHHRRPVPDRVDEEITVSAPAQCPACGGPLIVEGVESQYQEEIVRRTWVRRFHVPVCRCEQCDQRVQGSHPLQTSDALGAAAVQVGPEAVTLGVLMNKSLGLPHADAAAILQQGFGLTMSRSGICRAIQRVARKAEATWHALRDAAQHSALAHMDETGWKVEAQLRWLWAVVTEQVTFCEILPGRGFAEAAAILGAEYAGWLIHDGWAVYYKFLKAAHQSCVAHLIRRCRDLAAVATPYLFTFLYCPGLVDATNNLAERVMRMLVVIRKNWGGNRTEKGARAQAILTSVLCTARQQDKDVFELLTDLLRSGQPKLLDILPAEAGAVAESTPTESAAAGELVVETLPACADIPLPVWLPPPGNPCLFSSA